MKRALLFALVATTGAACGDDSATCTGQDCTMFDAPVSMVDAPAPPFTGDPLIGVGTVEVVAGGFMFTEGPQWRETQGDLVFSDIPASTIFHYTPGGGAPAAFRMPSGNSNGLAIDGTGAVIAAQHDRTVTRDGTVIASLYMGMQLNSPNDVIVANDGTIYFTDPPYGLSGPSALGFNGVFRLKTDTTLIAEYMGGTTERPNGIGISPDGATVYVDDTSDGKLYTFTHNADGSLTGRTMLATTAGGADGLAVDAGGNIFVAANGGIDVFAPSGTKWGSIPVAMKPANCAFGDADHQTLYITAGTTLYKVRLAHPGLPRN